MKYARKATSGRVPQPGYLNRLAATFPRPSGNPAPFVKRPGLSVDGLLAKLELTNNYGLAVTHIHHERPCTGKHCQECRGTCK